MSAWEWTVLAVAVWIAISVTVALAFINWPHIYVWVRRRIHR